MGMDDEGDDDSKPFTFRRRGRGRPPKHIKEEEDIPAGAATKECQQCGKVSLERKWSDYRLRLFYF